MYSTLQPYLEGFIERISQITYAQLYIHKYIYIELLARFTLVTDKCDHTYLPKRVL